MAYLRDSNIWKGVFLHKDVFGIVKSLITRMANYNISKMAAEYRCFGWILPVIE